MTIKKYVAVAGRPSIQPVEVLRETASCVYVAGFSIGGGTPPDRKKGKRTDYENYFDSWAEAHEFLLLDAARKLNAALSAVARAEKLMTEVKAMREQL